MELAIINGTYRDTSKPSTSSASQTSTTRKLGGLYMLPSRCAVDQLPHFFCLSLIYLLHQNEATHLGFVQMHDPFLLLLFWYFIYSVLMVDLICCQFFTHLRVTRVASHLCRVLAVVFTQHFFIWIFFIDLLIFFKVQMDAL